MVGLSELGVGNDLADTHGSAHEHDAQSAAQQKLAHIQQSIAAVQTEIDSPPETIRVIGASKAQSIETVIAFAEAGLCAFGENYLQEALPKLAALHSHKLEWHFIGRVQANKARQVAASFAWVQTLDSVRLAQRLSSARMTLSPHSPLNCCIQVNIDHEPQKAGVVPEAFDDLVMAAGELPGLRLRGVMAIPAAATNLASRIDSFNKVRALFQHAKPACSQHWDTVSLGMSGDYLDAIRCGANLIRLGTTLFGPRPPR
ncbi:MAG: YggS family pyridoxal phosphate-dependent enzyme [Gammaproteobacteria bacterium]|nr:YggS family pyridoxal phosphate-dependent enzyme [Gammaproteobacteria bacterium]